MSKKEKDFANLRIQRKKVIGMGSNQLNQFLKVELTKNYPENSLKFRQRKKKQALFK